MDLLLLSDLAQRSEQLLSSALAQPGPLTLALVFAGGALTSLGPCSLSLLPVTLAYLAGFEDGQTPWQRSLAFCGGIVGALVLLGSLSGLLGRIYGQVPALVPTLVAMLAVVMGLNLLGVLKIPLPAVQIPTAGARRCRPRWRRLPPAWPLGWRPHPAPRPCWRCCWAGSPRAATAGGHRAAEQLRHRPGAAPAAGRHLRRQRAQAAGAAADRPLGAASEWRGAAGHRTGDAAGALELMRRRR